MQIRFGLSWLALVFVIPFFILSVQAEVPAGTPSIDLPSQSEVNGYQILGMADSSSLEEPIANATASDEPMVYDIKALSISGSGDWRIAVDGILRRSEKKSKPEKTVTKTPSSDESGKIVFLRKSSTAKAIRKTPWDLKKDLPFLRSKVSLAPDWVPNSKGEVVAVSVKLPLDIKLLDSFDSDEDKKADLILLNVNGQAALLHLDRAGAWSVVIQPMGGC